MKVRLFLFICAVLMAVLASPVFAQSRANVPRGAETGPDAIGLRLENAIKESVGDTHIDKRPAAKQAQEDFLRIQQISRLLTEMSASESGPIALDLVTKAAKDVNRRANRLKSILRLPKPPKQADTAEPAQASSIDGVKNQIEQLEASVAAFASNPMFRNTQAAGRNLSAEASVDLQKVIEASRALERSADQLSSAGQKK
ncbi:MAG: hypothetical protein L0229_19190 [Blastocatellia bacterium]|nr:hypothetical protein [Blastocatellia bacterium]